jgi:hypothetical protein
MNDVFLMYVSFFFGGAMGTLSIILISLGIIILSRM